jgi:hypothetical protein
VKTIITVSMVAAILLSACSGGGTDSVQDSVIPTDITVERGPVLGATVRDSKGQIGKSQGNGVYRFTNPSYPIESFGGYIDINRDGVAGVGDVAMGTLRLRTQSGNVMTIGTTMSENNETLSALIADGFSEDELLNARPSTDIDNAALSDEVYKYCLENNVTDPALLLLKDTNMTLLRGRIQDRKNEYSYLGLDAAALESILVSELALPTLQEDINTTDLNPMDNITNAIPASDLSLEQKDTLAYMWDEERLARDLYLALNELYPSQTLYNIATKAESQHALSVEGLIEKYDLNILNAPDYTGGYSQEILNGYVAGEFTLDVIKDLYDTLYVKGSASLQDTLEVGCMVEVTDINDLDRDIEIAAGAEDLVLVFENLRSGSYSHYWAFDKALKSQGVSTGCCVLGETYCKTTQEYPQNEKMGGRY